MIRKDFERWENAMVDAVNATGRLLLSLLIGLCSLTIKLSKKGKKELHRGRRKDQRAIIAAKRIGSPLP